MIMITTKLNDKPELSPYFPDGTLCHQDDSGSKYYCQVIVVIVIVIMIIMIMINIIVIIKLNHDHDHYCHQVYNHYPSPS